MLLVNPPVFRPCEAPAGVAALAGFMNGLGRGCAVLDANLEGLEYLVFSADAGLPDAASDTWTRRALKGRARAWEALGRASTYSNPDGYRRRVFDLDRALGALSGGRVGLSSFSDPELSPLKSADLLESARNPGRNPFYPYFSARLSRLLEENDFKFVGFSLNYLDQALCAFAMAGFVRSIRPYAKLVLGGGLVSSWSSAPGREGLFSELFDHVCPGPGEKSLFAVPGLLPEAAGEKRARFSARPEYGKLPDAERYLAPGPIMPLSASSGCYWNRCAFCPERAEGNAYVQPPPGAFLSMARGMCAESAPALVHFLDNALSPALLARLAAGGPLGAPWYGFARFCPELADPDFCFALRDSGCRMLKLGLESGSQEVLDAMNKGIDLGLAARVLENLSAAGIGTYVYLLFGTPAEDHGRARATLDFVARRAGMIGFLNVAVFNLPAFAIVDGAGETREFYGADLSLYRDFRHPRGWDRKAVRAFLDREFRRDPDIAAVIRRDPPFFTSNHAPFFVPEGGR